MLVELPGKRDCWVTSWPHADGGCKLARRPCQPAVPPGPVSSWQVGTTFGPRRRCSTDAWSTAPARVPLWACETKHPFNKSVIKMMEIGCPPRKPCKWLTEHVYVEQQKVAEVCEEPYRWVLKEQTRVSLWQHLRSSMAVMFWRKSKRASLLNPVVDVVKIAAL